MVTFASRSCFQPKANETSSAFEPLIPPIERVARFAFRRVARWRRAELVADVVAESYAAFVRLVERGLRCLAYPTVLAKYAVRRIKADRQLGQRQNASEVLDSYAQRKRGFGVEPLPTAIAERGWDDLTADGRKDPSEVAALRLDLGDWLGRLTRTKRLIALRLAIGDSTSEVAQRLGLTSSRISQIRRELQASWNLFQCVTAGT